MTNTVIKFYDLEELFPCRRDLIIIAKTKLKELCVLQFKNKFNDIQDIYRFRINMFINTNINKNDEILQHKLFDDSIISNNFFNSIE